MSAQKILFDKLAIARTNFQIMHWKTIGNDFDNMHANVTNGYYEKVSSDLDDVAEILIRQGENPDSYTDVVKNLVSVGGANCVLSGNENYTRDQIVSNCDKILGDIYNAIVAVLDSEEMKPTQNAGIKSYYENLLDEYDKEYRFLNERRKNH